MIEKMIKLKDEGKEMPEIAEQLGIDRKKVNNFFTARKNREKKAHSKLPRPAKVVAVSSLSSTRKTPGKMVVVITSDVEQIKKLLTEL
jgi:orotate phosphoribosyltransferase-like protein